MKKIFSFLAAMLLFAGGAQAAAPATHDWSGYYVGGSMGYAYESWSIPFYDSQVPAGGHKTVSATGLVGGLDFGRNWQTNNWVYGLEADLQASGLKQNQGSGFSFDSCGCFTISMDSFATVRGRAGVDLNNGALIYGTGGVIVGHMDYNPDDSSPEGSSSQYHVGWTAGIGGEMNVTNTVSFKAEGLYYDFGHTHFDVGNTGFNTSMRVNGFIPRVGFNVHY